MHAYALTFATELLDLEVLLVDHFAEDLLCLSTMLVVIRQIHNCLGDLCFIRFLQHRLRMCVHSLVMM
jgi:hypothetical protein